MAATSTHSKGSRPAYALEGSHRYLAAGVELVLQRPFSRRARSAVWGSPVEVPAACQSTIKERP
jgi:hypothetical protein